jgi:small subunit ribosomal protein S2
MVNIPTTEELFEAVVYLGHRPSKLHPKMAQYVYTLKNNTYWIDLEKTRKSLEEVTEFLKELSSKNGIILFVGTKPTAQKIIKKYALEVNMPYVTEKWIGGTLTNFPVVSQLIEKLKRLEEEKEKGEWEKYPRKERQDFEKELNRLNDLVGGLRNLTRLPDAVYLVDVKVEKIAAKEAKKMKLKTIGLVDLDNNPTLIDYPIPANDEASASIEIITKTITEAIKEGKK